MVLVIDPQIAGISGDMFLSSLVDLGANKEKIIKGITMSSKSFTNSQIHNIDFKKIKKNGIESTELLLTVEESLHERKAIEIKNAIVSSIDLIQLSDKAKSFAISCIDILTSSESKIHGIPEDSVHFHEASSIDTLVDIIGAAIALDDLKLFDEKIICLPISVGSGSITFSHGVMSNPASAILEIFKNSGLEIVGNNANGELTTPTGACILSSLSPIPSKFYPSLKVNSIGYGAGKKDFQSFSNVLKLVRGQNDDFGMDSVKILETNLDDVSGEIIGNLIEKIMVKGARDISVFSGISKKGRPTYLVSIICDDEKIDPLLDTLILETGTLGIRIFDSSRLVVSRSNHDTVVTLNGKSFSVHYKKSYFKDKVRFKIEFEDLKKISSEIAQSIPETEFLLRCEIEKLEKEK